MKTLLAILVGKSIFFLSRFLGLGGGFAAPGLYALKIDRNFISNLTSKIPKQIIITGTNGKTTTSAMLTHLFKNEGMKVLRNKTGSNLERGIASTLIRHSPLFGNIKEQVAVWEVDEAAFNSLALKIQPEILVILNVYRDQLDRYGEVDSIVKKWLETVKKLPATTKLLINGDDGSLEEFFDLGKEVEAFSVPGTGLKGELKPRKIRKVRFTGTDIKTSLTKSAFNFKFDNCEIPVTLTIAGAYNVDNAVAALSAKFLAKDLSDSDAQSLKDFGSAFGRSEKFTFNGKEAYIFLIKNPAGATQVMETVLPNLKPEDVLLLALNDNFADGKDISWIWDIELEKFKIENSKFKIIVSGVRAYDMALRLKYAGVDEDRIIVEPSLEAALEDVAKIKDGKLFILPTYTAMLELQKVLVKKGVKKHYWKE